MNLDEISSGIECRVQMYERIVPADLPVEVRWLDLRLDLRVLQCSREVEDELENGEMTAVGVWPPTYSHGETLGVPW